MKTLSKTKIHQVALAALLLALSFPRWAPAAQADELAEKSTPSRLLSSPTYAIRSVQDSHSSETSVIVGQSELDALIDSGGGGACPVSAALIAMQTLRSMAGQSPHPQPHRYTLQLFQSHPELKEGRISNERFVNLFGWVSNEIEGYNLLVDVVSAKNSPHAKSGPFWPDEAGPELALRGGELCVLAYTVTQPGGNVYVAQKN